MTASKTYGRRLLKAVTITSLLVLAYVVSFRCVVNSGAAMYSLNGLSKRDGTVTFYWFSRNQSANTILYSIYQPVLRSRYRARTWSSFRSYEDYIAWCESGGSVFLDEVHEIP